MTRQTDKQLLDTYMTRPADVARPAFAELRRRYLDGDTDETVDNAELDEIFADAE